MVSEIEESSKPCKIRQLLPCKQPFLTKMKKLWQKRLSDILRFLGLMISNRVSKNRNAKVRFFPSVAA